METKKVKNPETFMERFANIGDSAAEVATCLSSVQNMVAQLLSIVVKHDKANLVVMENDFDFGLYSLNQIINIFLEYQKELDRLNEHVSFEDLTNRKN